ncbi:MAG: protein phosphatase 2C domain-containing protein [Kiritimatiellia bacterium]
MRDAFSQFKFAERTDKGRVRENNEDVILCLPEAGLFAIADGMGGAREGEVAARAAIEHLRESCGDAGVPLLTRFRRCRDAVNDASLWIRQYATRHGNPGMGTTLVVLLFDLDDPAAAAVLHAGDSRLYRFRKGVLEQMTRDHSVAAMAGVGEGGHLPPMFRSVITRSVGARRSVELDTTTLDVQRGDLFLLCSDGLPNMVSRDKMAAILGAPQDLEGQAEALIKEALDQGGDDNISVVLVRAEGAPDGETPVTADAEPVPLRDMPSPAHDTPPRRVWGPLASLLAIALAGVVAVWFAFLPASDPPPTVPASVPEPAPVEQQPLSLRQAAVVPNMDTNAVPGPAAVEAAWQAELAEVAAEPDRLNHRHEAVLRAFAQLSGWAGKPLPAPSLMIAGEPGERAEAWGRYLKNAQDQWRTFAGIECARLRAEASCLSAEALQALWRWDRAGDGPDPAGLNEIVADWEAWRRELDRMEKFFNEEQGVAPFLYALRADLFTPGGLAADLGDRTWNGVLPAIGGMWRKREYWIGPAGEADVVKVDEAIRQANAITGGYRDAGYAVRPWRQTMDPAGLAAFLELMRSEAIGRVLKRQPDDPH